jgi:hypothetical protein
MYQINFLSNFVNVKLPPSTISSITATVLLRKKNPSQVAQAETPFREFFLILVQPHAFAPVAITIVFVLYSFLRLCYYCFN